MAKAKNKVVGGDYTGYFVAQGFSGIVLRSLRGGAPKLSKETVETWEELNSTSETSTSSAVGRAFVGGALLGPVGLLAGLTAKPKGVHVVALEFKDGKRSLLELDDKIFRALTAQLF